MEVKDIVIPRTRRTVIKLFCLGDIHAGTIHCVENKIKRKVQEITETKNAYWVGMGDYAEFITPNDRRFDPAQKAVAEWVEQDNIAESQTKWIVDLFTPIKEKCWGLLYGNHEDSIRKFNHDNVQKNICERLGVDNLGFSCFLKVHFKRHGNIKIYKCALTHGATSAITEGAKLMALMRWMKANDADIYAYGHCHDYMPKSLSRLAVSETGKIKQKVSIGATTGSWFRTYTQGIIASYGEMKAYPPTEITAAVFTIDPEHDFIDVNRSV